MASSFAPSANIELVSCASGVSPSKGVLAVANLVNAGGPYPGVLSMSYGLCEAATGNGGNAYFYNAFEQAAAQGISAFASSGDAGTGQCGNIFNGVGSEYNVTSLAVTGWGESPFNVSVGGTDFEDTYNSKTGQNGGSRAEHVLESDEQRTLRLGFELRSGDSMERRLRQHFNCCHREWQPVHKLTALRYQRSV
jgi:subtilase family serine protease